MKTCPFQVGVNLGGWISQYPVFDNDHFRSFITEADINQIADWGIDHIRLPVDYPLLESDSQPFTYRDQGFAYIDRCLEWCRRRGLGVVLDLHRAPGFSFTAFSESTLFQSLAQQDRFVALWEEITRHYEDSSANLAFELLNEIVLPSSSPWNSLARRAIAAIRSIDSRRVIIVGGNRYNAASELANLSLPDDPRLLYTFHFYEPMVFTHQKARWVQYLVDYGQRVEYPGTCPDLEEFLAYHPDLKPLLGDLVGRELNQEILRQALQPAVSFSQKNFQALYCGEYGAIEHAPLESRLRWHRDFTDLLRQHGIGRAVWSYKQMGFGLVDKTGKVISPELVKIISKR